MVQVAGCRVQGSGFRFRVQGAGLRVQGAGFRVRGSGCRVQSSEFRVQGAGCRVQGSGFRPGEEEGEEGCGETLDGEAPDHPVHSPCSVERWDLGCLSSLELRVFIAPPNRINSARRPPKIFPAQIPVF